MQNNEDLFKQMKALLSEENSWHDFTQLNFDFIASNKLYKDID